MRPRATPLAICKPNTKPTHHWKVVDGAQKLVNEFVINCVKTVVKNFVRNFVNNFVNMVAHNRAESIF